MVLMNNDASNTVTLSSLEVSSCDKYTGTIQLESGEQKTISLTGCPPGSSGSKYSFSVVIHYTNPSGLSITQYGMKDLVGTYE